MLQSVIHKQNGRESSFSFRPDDGFIDFLKNDLNYKKEPVRIPTRYGAVFVNSAEQGWYTIKSNDEEGRDVATASRMLLALLHRWNREKQTLNRMEALMRTGKLQIQEEPEEIEVEMPDAAAPVKPGTIHIDKKALEEKRRREYVPPSKDKLDKLREKFGK